MPESWYNQEKILEAVDRAFEVPEPIKPPEAKDVLPEPAVEPEPPKVSEEDIKEARRAYVAAKKSLDDFGLFKNVWNKGKSFFSLKAETKEDLERKHQKAKVGYEKARTEYVYVNDERFLDERDRILEETIKQDLPDRSWRKQAYDSYKNLSNKWNLAAYVERKRGKKIENRFAKFALGAFNARTLVSASLLGAGIVAGGLTATGAAFFGARRVFGGIGSAVGTYDLLNLARGGLDRMKLAKNVENLDDLNEIEQRMASIEARVRLDGKTFEVLQADDLYQQLKAQRAVVFKRQASQFKKKLSAPSREGKEFSALEREFKFKSFLQSRMAAGDGVLEKSLKREKNWRRGFMVAGAVVGAFVGTGGVQKVIRWFNPDATEDATEGFDRGAIQQPGEPKPDFNLTNVEPKLPDISLAAGSRGIEGALLDLQKTNAPSFQKMLNWMNSQEGIHSLSKDPEANEPGRLVHRFVLKFIEEHKGEGYTIGDGGPKDLNRMFQAGMVVHGDGTVDFDSGNFKFMPKSEVLGQEVEPPGEKAFTVPQDFAGTKEEALAKISEIAREQASRDLGSLGSEVNAKMPAVEYQQANLAGGLSTEQATGRQFLERTAERSESTIYNPQENMDDYDEPSENPAKSPGPGTVLEGKDSLLVEAHLANDTTSGLRRILPEGQFRHLMKEVLKLDNGKLNSLKNLTLYDFVVKIDQDKDFFKKFSRLGKLIFENTNHDILDDDAYAKKTTIKKWLLEYALKIKK